MLRFFLSLLLCVPVVVLFILSPSARRGGKIDSARFILAVRKKRKP